MENNYTGGNPPGGNYPWGGMLRGEFFLGGILRGGFSMGDELFGGNSPWGENLREGGSFFETGGNSPGRTCTGGIRRLPSAIIVFTC